MSRLSRLKILPTNRTKQLFKRICEQYDLVYFGNVSQHSDDHQMVRGFTLSPSHVDRHYCVGTVSGKDVILLERTDTISFPDKPSRSYTWVILQVDLKRQAPYQLMLNSFKYDDIVYNSLFTKLSHLHKHSQYSNQFDAAFNSHFTVYAPLQHMDSVSQLLTLDTASILGHHFHGLDVELIDDELIVYYATSSPQPKMIDQLFKAGLWMASECDAAIENYYSNQN